MESLLVVAWLGIVMPAGGGFCLLLQLLESGGDVFGPLAGDFLEAALAAEGAGEGDVRFERGEQIETGDEVLAVAEGEQARAEGAVGGKVEGVAGEQVLAVDVRVHQEAGAAGRAAGGRDDLDVAEQRLA